MSEVMSKLMEHLDAKEQEERAKAQAAWAELVVAVAEETKSLRPQDILVRLSVAGKKVEDLDAAVKTFLERRGLAKLIEDLGKQVEPRPELRKELQTAIAARDQAMQHHKETIGGIQGRISTSGSLTQRINEAKATLLKSVPQELRSSFNDSETKLRFLKSQIQSETNELKTVTERLKTNTLDDEARKAKEEKAEALQQSLAQLEAQMQSRIAICEDLQKQVLVPSIFLS